MDGKPASTRRPRIGRLVATLMTAILFMIAAVVCAWFFHVLPHMDLLSSKHLSVEPTNGRTSKLYVAPSKTSGSSAIEPGLGSVPSLTSGTTDNRNNQPATATQTSGSPQPAPEPVHEAHAFCPPLSLELLHRHARRNTVMLTFASFDAFKTYGRTFLSHLKSANITYGLMAVSDLHTARLVAHSRAPCFTIPGAANHTDIRPQQLPWLALPVVRAVHDLGLHVLHSALEVVWFRDALGYLVDTHTQPDLIVSLDSSLTANPLGDEGLEAGVSLDHPVNTGLYFLRAGRGGSALLAGWLALMPNASVTQSRSEEEGLRMYLQELKPEWEVDRGQRLVRLHGGAATLAQLPPSLFQGGYSHTIIKLHEVHRVQPYALHVTWVHGRDAGKVHRLRELQLMDDLPEYYQEGLYLTTGMTPVRTPAGFSTMADAYAQTEHHWKAMQQQLRDMYYAIAIAYCADRILVLPRLTCHCVHNQGETQQCRLPGDTLTQLPFTCPADYVFDMEKLSTLLVTSRRVQFREHSWLDNPKTHSKYKSKPFLVEAGAVDHPVHEASRHVLPSKYHDFELVGELGRLKQHPIIHVPNPEQLFKGFTHGHIQQEFDRKLGELALTWCCLPDHVVKERGLPNGTHPLKVQP